MRHNHAGWHNAKTMVIVCDAWVLDTVTKRKHRCNNVAKWVCGSRFCIEGRCGKHNPRKGRK